MKKQLNVKKLVLKKETICEVGGVDMKLVKGGLATFFCQDLSEVSRCADCLPATHVYICVQNTVVAESKCACQ